MEVGKLSEVQVLPPGHAACHECPCIDTTRGPGVVACAPALGDCPAHAMQEKLHESWPCTTSQCTPQGSPSALSAHQCKGQSGVSCQSTGLKVSLAYRNQS